MKPVSTTTWSPTSAPGNIMTLVSLIAPAMSTTALFAWT